MTEPGVPIVPREWGDEGQGVAAPAKPAAAATAQDTCPYYILYYAEASNTGVMGPMKRARYGTVWEAAERAMEMRRLGAERPVEIRDPQDRLITCELMGWKLPSLVRPEPARRPSPPAGPTARIA
ncbi:hypothetical protein [Ancylobacter radicis]|uniref:Uncharacterized protein n=1 Tax=Ancylobacter radicis TaxID=2836179 RepID=A0ABS5RA79_9HYPH|nr:hypothetical protein [Ancylobacter radicis]MBS9478417.1 hypothetical protein [Ancylobacter radicis]